MNKEITPQQELVNILFQEEQIRIEKIEFMLDVLFNTVYIKKIKDEKIFKTLTVFNKIIKDLEVKAQMIYTKLRAE